jgi:hypothetical protein
LHLKSPDNEALINISGPLVAGTLLSYEFGSLDTAKAKITMDTVTRVLSIVDQSDNVRLQITPNVPVGNILFTGPLLPMTDGAWGLSNGNLAGFKSLFLNNLTATIADFTTTITLDSQGSSIIILNNGEADSIATSGSKDATLNNSFITATSRILVNVIGLNGVINAATVGVPYVTVTSVGAGTCTLRTYNISATQMLTKRVTIALLLLP